MISMAPEIQMNQRGRTDGSRAMRQKLGLLSSFMDHMATIEPQLVRKAVRKVVMEEMLIYRATRTAL